MAPERDITITSRYVPILAEFMAKNDIRYYLNGIYVEPHPEQGVILIATDGHAMVFIHDKDGKANGSYICALPKQIVSACSAKKLKDISKNPQVLRFVGNAGYVLSHKDTDPTDIGKWHLHTAYCEIIEGKFPDWKKVIPRDLKPADRIEVNAVLLNKITKTAKISSFASPITVFTNGANDKKDAGAMLIRVDSMPELFAIVMPMRVEDKAALKSPVPEWVAASLDPEMKTAA
jgi:hypothetical protein